jgi:ankyrin repeat protein
MFNKILSSFSFTLDAFKKELLKQIINTELLDKIIANHSDYINHRDEYGNSLLILCILKKRQKSALWLIDNNINPLIKNDNNEDAINIAVRQGANLIVTKLLACDGIDLDQKDHEGRSLLQNAVIYGKENIVKSLIQGGIDINNTDNHNRNVVFDAVAYGEPSIIDLVISIPDLDLNVIDENGDTILHQEAVIKDQELSKNLIKKGADPTICNEDGMNLLFSSALRGMDGLALLDVAVEEGYSLNAPVKKKNTILMETLEVFYKLPIHEEARRESLLNMANKLVEKGLDVNALNEYGEHALFDAVRHNDYQTCAILIQNKVDVNKQNRLKQTPLLLACYKGVECLDVILLLLHNYADPNIKNELNQSVLEILNLLVLHTHNYKVLKNSYILIYLNTNAKYLVIVKEILQNSKFQLQFLDSQEQPLFFTPLLFGDYDLFKLYISNGFKINEKNNLGLNIFYVYVEFSFKINRYFDTFKKVLIRLIQEKVDINVINQKGKNIFSEVLNNSTNHHLYSDLINTCQIKYDAVDKIGRTIMHQAVLSKNLEVVRMLQVKNFDVVNIADSYGILPITYATLLDDFEVVNELLKNKHIYIKSNKKISQPIKEKFAKMVSNVDNLKRHTLDKDLLRKITILTDQVKHDFKI